MATKKADTTARDLRQLAKSAASRDTGVPISVIKPGKKPVAGKKATTTKKGKSK